MTDIKLFFVGTYEKILTNYAFTIMGWNKFSTDR